MGGGGTRLSRHHCTAVSRNVSSIFKIVICIPFYLELHGEWMNDGSFTMSHDTDVPKID